MTERRISIEPDKVGGRILAYLREHGSSPIHDVAGGTGITYASAVSNLGALAARGYVVRLRRGNGARRSAYCLAEQAPPDEDKWFRDLMVLARANERRRS